MFKFLSAIGIRDRRAYTLEQEPRFVDVAVKRWRTFSGNDAIHAAAGLTFDEITTKSAEVSDSGAGAAH